MVVDIRIAILMTLAILTGFIVIVVPWSKRLHKLFSTLLDADAMMVCAATFFLSVMAIVYLMSN